LAFRSQEVLCYQNRILRGCRGRCLNLAIQQLMELVLDHSLGQGSV
jgi:hypothetical protein